jgi:beta-N-acetylhexosaminidase
MRRARLDTPFDTPFICLFSPLVLLWGLQLADPHLSPIRPWHVPGLFLVCALLAWRCLRPGGALRMLGLSAALLGAAAGAIQQAEYASAQHRLLHGDAAAMRQVGAHFVVGYRDIEALKPLVERGLVGGVFITRRNVMGKSARQVREDIAQLQALRHARGLPPLIVATDQEGGPVSRLSPPLDYQPGLATLVYAYGADSADLAPAARLYGERQGAALAQLGVTVNFSPVVDLRGTPPTLLPDLHTRIDSRAIAADAQLTTRVALAYGGGLASRGVTPTLKHFPGLGGVAGDTHHFPASLDTPPDVLQARDWRPFRELAPVLEAWIMLGHVKLPALDLNYPASFSVPVVNGLIRGRWGFDGVLITDDLSMGGAYLYGLCNAIVRGLNAGVDLMLIAYDEKQIVPALDCAARAQRRGLIAAEKLRASDARLSRDREVRELNLKKAISARVLPTSRAQL